MEPRAQTFAQTHLRQSHYDLQGGLLRNAEPHPNQAQQRTCACKRCLNLQQASNSPSTAGFTIPNPCLQHQGLRACAGAGADFNGECRYGIRSSHLPAHVPPHVLTPQGPCHGINPPHVPRSLHSNGMAMGAASALGFTPVASRFAPPSQNQEKDWKQNGPRMEASLKKSGSYGEPTKQVVLYRWFLIRSSGSSQGVEVSVGGFLTPGTAGIERFKTAAIVQRLEKCRLLAYDGLEVLLAGLIDDCTTVSNGFSLDIVQGFLSGFPYTWNLLLNNELSASNPRHPNHQVSGNSGLGRGVDTSQLSFEGSEQEKRILSPGFCDHIERVDMQPNMKQTITTEVQSEKEAATLNDNDLNTQPAVEGGEQLDTVSSRDDQIISSNSTGLAEQEIINVRIKEEQQEIACTDQSARNVKKRPGRPLKRQPDVGSEEDCSTLEQIGGSGTVILNKSNDSTQNVEKSDEKPQLTPRITRSMQKTSKLEAQSHNVSVGVNTGAHSDSLSNCEEVHTPAEQYGPYVKPRSSTTASLVHQKRMDNKRSRRTLSKDKDIENIDGDKSSTVSPCYYTGVKSPVEMGAQRPESFVNAEASPASKEEGRSNQKQACTLDLQKETCTLEAVQACHCGPVDEEGNVIPSVQMSKEHASFKSVEKLTKSSQNKLNKRVNDFVSKSLGQGNKCSKNPPPLSRSRAPVSKRLISAAFGLKTSRSGRLLVPPLAHWCSQALLRDKDGGIIGISEGSKNMNEDGSIKFVPPAEASLRKLQKRICEVATDCTPRRKRLGTKKQH